MTINDIPSSASYETIKEQRFTGRYVDPNGTVCWFRDGEYHREDGPAIETSLGNRVWYKNGKPHREDGPAVEYAHGGKRWYLDGLKLSKGMFEALLQEREAEKKRLEEEAELRRAEAAYDDEHKKNKGILSSTQSSIRFRIKRNP